MIEISIIIPTYNSAATIEKMVTSIVNQNNYNKYEIICVDDGSTDATWAKLMQLAASYDNVSCYHQKNQKQAVARNNGLKHAKGKYIMFADADDYWLQGVFETILPKLTSDLTVFGIKKDYGNTSVVELQSGMRGSKTQTELIQNYLSNNFEMDVGVWNKVFSKRIIDENQLHFSNGNFFEDSLFVLNYLVRVNPEKISYIDQALYVLNKRENTTTSQFSPDIIDRANNYMAAVKQVVRTLNVPYQEQKNMLNALECRLALHISHHYMLYATNWTVRWERSFLKEKVGVNAILSNKTLNNKYKLAWLLLQYCPRVYRVVYLKYKPEI